MLVCNLTLGNEKPAQESTNVNLLPVVLSARSVESKNKLEQKLEIQLTIQDGYEIYSERKHSFLLPLKTEVLDSQMRPITNVIRYPEPKTISFEDTIGGHFYAYGGKVKLVATLPFDAQPAYVRMFYHGNYRQHT